MLRQIEDEYLYPVAYAQTSFNEFVILTQAPLPSLVIDRTSIPPVGKPAVRWFGGGTPGSFCLFHGKPQCHLTSTSALWTWLGTTRIRNSTQVKIYHLLKCIFSFDFFFFLMLCHCNWLSTWFEHPCHILKLPAGFPERDLQRRFWDWFIPSTCPSDKWIVSSLSVLQS